MARGPCRTCAHWTIVFNPQNKHQKMTICTEGPPKIIMMPVQMTSNLAVARPGEMQIAPVGINPSTAEDYECGRWEAKVSLE